MLNNLINNVKNKINTIKEENENYNNILKKKETITNLHPIKELPNQLVEKNINNIMNLCPDLNKEKAILINKVIPISETYLTVMYTKEIITNIEYWLIPTNKYIWIINEKSYGIIPYQNITICNIIKNNLMSKSININNIILEINGNDEKINTFISIITNPNIREHLIKEKTSYLCNIIPIYQSINKNNSGISIDNNNNIVFHTNKENFKYNIKDLENYELLIDNNPIINKNQARNTHITSFQNTCYSISIRITTKDNSFIIPILEPNSFGTKYTNQDSTYQNNIKFAKEIINKLREIDQN